MSDFWFILSIFWSEKCSVLTKNSTVDYEYSTILPRYSIVPPANSTVKLKNSTVYPVNSTVDYEYSTVPPSNSTFTILSREILNFFATKPVIENNIFHKPEKHQSIDKIADFVVKLFTTHRILYIKLILFWHRMGFRCT